MRTHGMSYTPVYNAWHSMRYRCLNPKSRDYPNYGGRGITICERWLKFENFLADMGERPKRRRLTVGRIDNDRGYSPDNCRWETYTQQNNNNRRIAALAARKKLVRTELAKPAPIRRAG